MLKKFAHHHFFFIAAVDIAKKDFITPLLTACPCHHTHPDKSDTNASLGTNSIKRNAWQKYSWQQAFQLQHGSKHYCAQFFYGRTGFVTEKQGNKDKEKGDLKFSKEQYSFQSGQWSYQERRQLSLPAPQS